MGSVPIRVIIKWLRFVCRNWTLLILVDLHCVLISDVKPSFEPPPDGKDAIPPPRQIYPQPPGYPQQAGHPQQQGYPEQQGYPYQPGCYQQQGYPQPQQPVIVQAQPQVLVFFLTYTNKAERCLSVHLTLLFLSIDVKSGLARGRQSQLIYSVSCIMGMGMWGGERGRDGGQGVASGRQGGGKGWLVDVVLWHLVSVNIFSVMYDHTFSQLADHRRIEDKG